MLIMRHHRLRTDEIRSRQIAVAMTAGRVAESRAFADGMSTVDFYFQPFKIVLHGRFHVFRTPFELRIERIDGSRPFMLADAVEHVSRALRQHAAVEGVRGLHMDAMFFAERAPSRK